MPNPGDKPADYTLPPVTRLGQLQTGTAGGNTGKTLSAIEADNKNNNPELFASRIRDPLE